MKVIHSIEFFHISIIFHTIFFDLKRVKSIKQIEQLETRPKTAEKKCPKKKQGTKLPKNVFMFLVGAFLEKRVDYSHGFS